MKDRLFEKHVRFRNHQITLQKDDYKANWYIIVTGPDGCYAYDGWWRNSESATWQEALSEAKRGACIGVRTRT